MKYIFIITILYGLLPLIVYQFYKRKLVKINAIYPFIVVVFISSLYELIGTNILKISVQYWFIVYDILAFFSLQYFFYLLLNKQFKLFFFSLMLMYSFFIIISFNILNVDDFMTISSYLTVYQTIVVIIFSIIWFKKNVIELDVNNLFKDSYFYFITGIVIYNCGIVFLFLMANAIYLNNKSSLQYYWLLNVVLNLVLRTLLIIGIWKARVK